MPLSGAIFIPVILTQKQLVQITHGSRITMLAWLADFCLIFKTLNNCHFEHSKKSRVLIAKDSSLCSEWQ